MATSDSLVQMIIFGSGAERVSAREFVAEIEQTEEDLRNFIKDHNTQ